MSPTRRGPISKEFPHSRCTLPNRQSTAQRPGSPPKNRLALMRKVKLQAIAANPRPVSILAWVLSRHEARGCGTRGCWTPSRVGGRFRRPPREAEDMSELSALAPPKGRFPAQPARGATSVVALPAPTEVCAAAMGSCQREDCRTLRPPPGRCRRADQGESRESVTFAWSGRFSGVRFAPTGQEVVRSRLTAMLQAIRPASPMREGHSIRIVRCIVRALEAR